MGEKKSQSNNFSSKLTKFGSNSNEINKQYHLAKLFVLRMQNSTEGQYPVLLSIHLFILSQC